MRTNLLSLFLTTSLLLALATAQAQSSATPAIRFVSTTGTNSNPASATSWATSTTNLQGAINASASGDQVWVAAGVYKPGGNTNTNRSISFSMANSVTIVGGFLGNETALTARPAINPVTGQPSNTTLSGEIGGAGNGDNSYHVIRNPSGLNASALLDGFVITGGNANGSVPDNLGGGVYNDKSSPTFQNCAFQQNTASNQGGAMYNDGFRGTSSPVLTNCAFQQNSASNQGGAMYNDGQVGTSSPVLTNCTFQQNTAASDGGAMYNNGPQGTASPVITNCAFQQNTASNGGAMYNNGSYFGTASPVMTNCAFQQNSATSSGGAMYNDGPQGTASPVMTNCAFQQNSATSSGGAMYNDGSAVGISSPVLTNCVLFGNGGNNTFSNNSTTGPTATYSLFENGVTGFTNSGNNITGVTTSPFATTTSVALAPCSPAINAGNPASITVASPPYSATNLPATDLAGNPRIVGGRVDMGAVEFQSTPVAISTQPAAGSVVCAGGNVSVGVSTTGTVSTYQWFKDGAALNPAQTSATLSLTNSQAGDAGSYSVVVTGACNSLTSTAFSLTVNALLPTISITGTPASLTISSIQTATLTASGGNSYSWSTGANTAAIQVSVAGTYSVTGTTNGCSSTTSVVLSVTSAAPIITTQPATASSVCEGALVMVSAVVSNSVTSYQWLKGGNPVSGQTSATLSLGNVQPSDAGVYSLSVTGPGGSTTSNGFTLTVNPLPTVTLLVPTGVMVQGPGSGVATITVPANGLPTTFQALGGVLYERLIILDRTNGYEIRQVDSNQTGIFPINRLGLFTLTVTGAGGCKRTVQWVVQQ